MGFTYDDSIDVPNACLPFKIKLDMPEISSRWSTRWS